MSTYEVLNLLTNAVIGVVATVLSLFAVVIMIITLLKKDK